MKIGKLSYQKKKTRKYFLLNKLIDAQSKTCKE